MSNTPVTDELNKKYPKCTPVAWRKLARDLEISRDKWRKVAQRFYNKSSHHCNCAAYAGQGCNCGFADALLKFQKLKEEEK